VVASGAIGFAQYLTYLVPLNMWQQKAVSGSLVIIITALLYRQITSIGKISLLFGLIVFGTMIWIIAAGFMHFSTAGFTGFSLAGITPHNLGAAFTKVIYCYLGYYNVCHLGAEIKNPERNIPRSIFISIGIIAPFYVLMQIAVLAVLPWQQAKDSPFIISLFFERVYGPFAAQMATGLILLIAVSSLFAVLLGYSRVPYAAASDNNFFSVFAKLHPVKIFPYISLLTLAALAFVFSLLFKMQQIITAIIVMRVLVQFIAQISGLIMFHKKHPEQVFPFRMWLYPLPAVIAIGAWLFIFLCASPAFMLGAAGIIVLGVLLFYMPVYFPVKKS
jgi:fructoselysine transporter